MEAVRQRRRAGRADREGRSAARQVRVRRGRGPEGRGSRQGGARAPRHPGALEERGRSAARPGPGALASLPAGRRSGPGPAARVLLAPQRGAQGQSREEARADRPRRGDRRLHRLDQDRRRAEEAAGRMAAGRPGAAPGHQDHLETVPRRLRPVLHPAERRSRRTQGNLVGQPRRARRRSAPAPRSSPTSKEWDRAASEIRRLQTEWKSDRSGPAQQVRSGLAALPHRVRHVLRSLQAARRDRAGVEAGRSRTAGRRARGARAGRRQRHERRRSGHAARAGRGRCAAAGTSPRRWCATAPTR